MESIHGLPVFPVETTPSTKPHSRLVHLLQYCHLESMVCIKVHTVALYGYVVSAHCCGNMGAVSLPGIVGYRYPVGAGVKDLVFKAWSVEVAVGR